MDGQRFDDLARKLGAGLSRRQLMRAILGGGAALATTTVLKDHASAQVGPGGACTTADDCDLDLICSNGECSCNPSVSQDGQCPAGSPVSGNSGLPGSCCNGNGNCCSRNCVEGACLDTPPACMPQGIECSETFLCCEGLTCIDGRCAAPCAIDTCNEPCENCWAWDSEASICVGACVSGQICCEEACVTGVCCDADDCTNTDDCRDATCVNGACFYEPNDENCADIGDCSSKTCGEGGSCLYSQAPDNCSGCQYCSDEFVCINECPGGQVCCEETCVPGECCSDGDCPYVACERVTCGQDHYCGAISLCPAAGPGTIKCCAVGPGEDYCYGTQEGVPADCCTNEDCGVAIAGESCLVGLCMNGLCYASPDDSLCGQGTCCCEDGSCSPGCCEASTCDDDHDCPKGSICCAGYCREIECCIDDILWGGDPNDRCPDKCTCFEGLCVDKDQNHCRVCVTDKECPKDECCCRNGICSEHCCGEPGCKSDKDCAKGTCCCKNGSCSTHCCDRPDDDTPEIEELPNTGAGPDEGTTSWIAGAALAAGAAALLGAKTARDAGLQKEEQ